MINKNISQKTFDIRFWAANFQTVVYLPFSVLSYKLYQWRGTSDLHILPEFHVVLIELIVCTVAEEVAFFYSHWLLHHKRVRHIERRQGFFKKGPYPASLCLFSVFSTNL